MKNRIFGEASPSPIADDDAQDIDYVPDANELGDIDSEAGSWENDVFMEKFKNSEPKSKGMEQISHIQWMMIVYTLMNVMLIMTNLMIVRGGWQCSICIKKHYGFQLTNITTEFVKQMHWKWVSCMKSIIDCIITACKCLKNFLDLVFGDDGVHSKENVDNDLDSKWIGLSVDQISELVDGFGCDEDDVNKYMII